MGLTANELTAETRSEGSNPSISAILIWDSSMYLDPQYEHLVDQALWMVIDPWTLQPNSKPTDPTNYINQYFCAFIAYSLSNFQVQHKCISLDEKQYTRSPCFSGYLNMDLGHEVEQYLTDHKLENIVYTGFHHGSCIIDRCTGAKAMREKATIYVKKDCTCTLGNFPENEFPFGRQDAYTKEHVDWII